MSELDSEFLEIFRDEASGRLDRIVDTLLALESGQRGAPTRSTRCSATSTRSRAPPAWSGSTDVSALAHVMEDVLAGRAPAAGRWPPSYIDPLLRAADALRRHVAGERRAEPRR